MGFLQFRPIGAFALRLPAFPNHSTIQKSTLSNYLFFWQCAVVHFKLRNMICWLSSDFQLLTSLISFIWHINIEKLKNTRRRGIKKQTFFNLSEWEKASGWCKVTSGTSGKEGPLSPSFHCAPAPIYKTKLFAVLGTEMFSVKPIYYFHAQYTQSDLNRLFSAWKSSAAICQPTNCSDPIEATFKAQPFKLIILCPHICC